MGAETGLEKAETGLENATLEWASPSYLSFWELENVLPSKGKSLCLSQV